MPTRNVGLPEKLEQEIDNLVTTGRYQNASEVRTNKMSGKSFFTPAPTTTQPLEKAWQEVVGLRSPGKRKIHPVRRAGDQPQPVSAVLELPIKRHKHSETRSKLLSQALGLLDLARVGDLS
jgi:hypothetical protein